MIIRHSLQADERGASVMEFAFLAPFLLSVVIGAAQVGVLFFANAGLQHAVGEGARVAMISPRPTTDTIREAVIDAAYGMEAENALGEPTIQQRWVGCDRVADVTWRYRVPLSFIFFETPPVTLTQSRTVYLQPSAADGPCPNAGGSTGGGGSSASSSTSSTGGTSTSSSTGGTGTSSTTTGGTAGTTTGGTTGTTTGGTAGTTTGGTAGTTSGGSTTSTTSGGSTTSTSTTSSTSTGGSNASSGNNNASSGGSNGNGKGSDAAKNNNKK